MFFDNKTVRKRISENSICLSTLSKIYSSNHSAAQVTFSLFIQKLQVVRENVPIFFVMIHCSRACSSAPCCFWLHQSSPEWLKTRIQNLLNAGISHIYFLWLISCNINKCIDQKAEHGDILPPFFNVLADCHFWSIKQIQTTSGHRRCPRLVRQQFLQICKGPLWYCCHNRAIAVPLLLHTLIYLNPFMLFAG